MKKHLMPVGRFDITRIGKQVLYIFPYPYGMRCVARISHDPVSEESEVQLYDTRQTPWSNISDFAPDVTDALSRLYPALFDEPDRRFTRNGRQVVFPSLIVDLVLHDRTDGKTRDEGAATALKAALADYDDIGAPARSGVLCALLLCVMLEDEYNRGSTSADIWQQRAWLKRGLLRMGLRNPYAHPRPVVRELAQSPRSWHWESDGIASDRPDDNWRMIECAFQRSFRGALVVDVWQPWAVGGDAFRLISAEDMEV